VGVGPAHTFPYALAVFPSHAKPDSVTGVQSEAAMTKTELTPEELDEAVVRQARRVERERNKRRVLALLEEVPADSILWDRVLVLAERQDEKQNPIGNR